MIPRRLIRTVPANPSAEADELWRIACDLHPGWEHVDLRDPIDPAGFPLVSPWWDRVDSGAQLAGLVRMEELLHRGGCYIDSDVELYRPLDDLLDHRMVAAWEDDDTVPDAVLLAEPDHPALHRMVALAVERLRTGGDDWRTGRGAWSTGPGVCTTVLPGRDDVTLLGPESFYPYHYSERHRRHEDHRGPGTWGAHHWAASWL